MQYLRRGLVQFFSTDRGYGFMLADGEKMFFHINDGWGVAVGVNGPDFARNAALREPVAGDILLFEKGEDRQGRTKAQRWVFLSDVERANRKYAERQTHSPRYRVLEHTLPSTGGRRTKKIFDGSLEELRARFPIEDYPFTPSRRSKGRTISYTFEVRLGSEPWKSYSGDPRLDNPALDPSSLAALASLNATVEVSA